MTGNAIKSSVHRKLNCPEGPLYRVCVVSHATLFDRQVTCKTGSDRFSRPRSCDLPESCVESGSPAQMETQLLHAQPPEHIYTPVVGYGLTIGLQIVQQSGPTKLTRAGNDALWLRVVFLPIKVLLYHRGCYRSIAPATSRNINSLYD